MKQNYEREGGEKKHRMGEGLNICSQTGEAKQCRVFQKVIGKEERMKTTDRAWD